MKPSIYSSRSCSAGMRRQWPALLLLLLVFVPTCAQARPEFVAVATTTYPAKADGNVAKALASCGLCHAAEGAPKLNPYGTDLKAALKKAGAQTLSAEILHSLDAKDSDADGFTNGKEFASDTLPGDATSKPSGPPDAGKTAAAGVGAGASSSTATPSEEANPFDLKTLLLPKHAQHPVIVHFPIALFIVSLFFDLLAVRLRSRPLATVGYYNLLVATVSAPFALISGLLAWQFAFGGMALKGNILYHLVLACVTTVFLFILIGIRRKSPSEGDPKLSAAYVILGLLAFLAIAATGHLGGSLVGAG